MKKTSNVHNHRLILDNISRSTRGGIRGIIEPFGLYTVGI